MAKNSKSKTVNKKTRRQSATLLKLKKVKWYFWLLLLATTALAVFQVYKYLATQNDIKLLDQAEAKMRLLSVPEGAKTTIERYCSERSVKYGSPGKPTCGVEFSFVYNKSESFNNENTKELLAQLLSMGYKLEKTDSGLDRVYYDLEGMSPLNCYIGDVVPTRYLVGAKEQHITIYCQKQFQSKVYPVR